MSERRNLRVADRVEAPLRIDWGEVFFGWGGRIVGFTGLVACASALALPEPSSWKGPALADTRCLENPWRPDPYEYLSGSYQWLSDPFGDRIWVHVRGEVERAQDLPLDPVEGDMWRVASLGGYFIWESERGQWVDP